MPPSSSLPDDGRPLHARIKEWLLKQIQSYELESQIPSDRELARTLGASYLTVNKVMLELEREGYVVRRPGRGTFLASRERTVASDGEAGRKGEIVFAYPNHFSYGFWSRVRTAEELALKKGLGFVEFKMSRDTVYDRLIEVMADHARAKGLFVLPTPGSVTQDVAESLNELEVPVVVLATCDWKSPPANLYQVAPDTFSEGREKLACLLSHGHTAIGYVHNEPDSPETVLAWQGMRQALRDAGAQLKDLKRSGGATQPWQDSMESARAMARELLKKNKLTALVTDSQVGAIGAMSAINELGLRVPDDVSLVATSDGQNREQYLVPPLTTVLSDSAAEVSAGFDIILGVSRPGDHTTLIPVTLNERASVADRG